MSARHVAWTLIAAGLLTTSGCGTSSADVLSPQVQSIDVPATGRVWNAAGASVAGLAVVWGGKAGFEKEPDMLAAGWIVRIGTNSAVATSPSTLGARSNHLAIAAAGKVYIWGGLDKQGGVLDDGAVLDPVSNSWHSMHVAPVGLESPRATVAGEHLLIGAGRQAGNHSNSAILDYDTVKDSWTVLELGVPDIVDWLLLENHIVTVSRDQDGRSLMLHWFDLAGKATSDPTKLSTKLGLADYLGIASNSGELIVAASDRSETDLFRVNSSGVVLKEVTVAGDDFTPALRVPTASGSFARDGDLWLSFQEREVKAISLREFDDKKKWNLDVCRTDSVWVPLGAGSYLRYGGTPCGGDVPSDSSGPLAVVRL